MSDPTEDAIEEAFRSAIPSSGDAVACMCARSVVRALDGFHITFDATMDTVIAAMGDATIRIDLADLFGAIRSGLLGSGDPCNHASRYVCTRVMAAGFESVAVWRRKRP